VGCCEILRLALTTRQGKVNIQSGVSLTSGPSNAALLQNDGQPYFPVLNIHLFHFHISRPTHFLGAFPACTLPSKETMRLQTISLLLAATDIVRAATAAQWRSRSIYQVLTDRFALTNDSTTVACDPSLQHYCGGTWQGIISKLDYIQDMGFDAVSEPHNDHRKIMLMFRLCIQIWISPVTSQVKGNTDDGAAYHGFWPDNMNELNENFGTANDLKALSAALHSRGMVINSSLASMLTANSPASI
jgi:hypothetical protein